MPFVVAIPLPVTLALPSNYDVFQVDKKWAAGGCVTSVGFPVCECSVVSRFWA